MRERQLIRQIQEKFGQDGEALIKGIGDDCAVYSESGGTCWLLSTDLLVDDVHFIRKWQDAYSLGRKSLAVNLSDIAAMGGEARFALLSLAAPATLEERWLSDWLDGVASMMAEHGCLLIGGDTAKSAVLTINVVVVGSAPCSQVLYRSGARAGDDIYITGPTGLSAAGLDLLQKGVAPDGRFERLVKAHFDPQPRLAAGRLLGSSGYVSAMQDISDGLATDLSHISEASGTGAVIYGEMLPVDPELAAYCEAEGRECYNLMVAGGEDYELVFTADPRHRQDIERLADPNRPFSRIGMVLPESGTVYLETAAGRRDITFGGFEHTG